jgi:hypothetical protein
MAKPWKPRLHLVDDSGDPQNDVLAAELDKLSIDDVLIKPGHPDFVDPNAPEPERKPKTRKTSASKPARPRLPLSDKPFARVWLSELADHRLFPAATRLFLVLRFRSHEGHEKVRLTAAIAAEASIPNREKSHYARALERLGVVRIEREGQQELMLTVRRPPQK